MVCILGLAQTLQHDVQLGRIIAQRQRRQNVQIQIDKRDGQRDRQRETSGSVSMAKKPAG